MQQQLLIIDDTKAIHPLVTALLADESVDIHSAFDAESGIRLATSMRPDLILLDVEMPGVNGFDACRRLKADSTTASIPVVFLTGLDSIDEKVRGLELGAVDYVTKPFNRADLRARVRASLRTSHLMRLLEEEALIDSLTGLGNRAMFDQRLSAEVSLRTRSNNPLACILLDLDEFKSINDRFGHPFGDQVLHKVGQVISDLCRAEDVACRYGGEEFVIITPNTTAASAVLLAERMRTAISKINFVQQGSPIKLTCSFGVADAIESHDRSLVQRADDALYQSKQAGRNRVTIAAQSGAARSAVA